MGDYSETVVTVLVISNGADATADYLCSRMAATQISHLRLNTEETPSVCRFAAQSGGRSSVTISGAKLTPRDVSTVWYRRPRPISTDGSQYDEYERRFVASEWTIALEGFLAQVPTHFWISHPSCIMAASNKLEQLNRAVELGLRVPAWLCVTETEHALAFLGVRIGGS